MSIRAILWSLDQDVFPSSHKFVLIALANFSNERGKSYPSVSTICQLTSQKDETVRSALKALVSAGFVTDTGQRTGFTGQVKVYQFPEPARERLPNSGVFEDPGKTPLKTQARPPKKGSNPVTCNLEPKITDIEATEVYAIYPRKVGRPAALKAIKRQIAVYGKVKLLEATKQFASEWVGANGDMHFCPNPATWFNQERFNDDPSTWKRTPKLQLHMPQQESLSVKMAKALGREIEAAYGNDSARL